MVPAAEVPGRRLDEIHLHHVDLGIGYTCADLPADFAARQLAVLLDGLSAREGIAAVRLRDSDTGQVRDIGAADRPERDRRAGPTGALLGLADRPQRRRRASPPIPKCRSRRCPPLG